MGAADLVADYLAGLPGAVRTLAPAQWGVTVEPTQAGGWPLDIGIRITDGLLRAQAPVADHHPEHDPWLFLHWNRQTRLVRFTTTCDGDLWIQGDLPIAAVDERALDRLLGLIVDAAVVARRYVTSIGETSP